MGDQVTLAAAFGAGFLSFISPCVLPLIPGYISFVSGVSLDEMQDGGRAGRHATSGAHHLAGVRPRLFASSSSRWAHRRRRSAVSCSTSFRSSAKSPARSS